MSDDKTYKVKQDSHHQTHLSNEDYLDLYRQSIENPSTFWGEQALQTLDWYKPFTITGSGDFNKGTASWFTDGSLNASYNCIDRHLPTKADQTAIIWEGDDPSESSLITYAELHDSVCRLANLLKKRGVKKGDRVCIYMPMIPEAAYAMLACARIGAIHSVVFGGFSPQALQDRILDSDCQTVITANEGLRGAKPIPLKANTDMALEGCPNVHSVLVIKRTSGKVNMTRNRDIWYHEEIQQVEPQCEPEQMASEDPLFILYTSGSTGKPKGVLHTTGGYLLQAAMTHKYVFDYHDGDVYWCTADVGWITGHSYIVYGPLANGATTLMFEGVPTYPDASRFWQVIEKHKVNIFYTAPTALRQLMGQGDDFVTGTNRSSLKLLGTVGEPINPEAWEWYFHTVGLGTIPSGGIAEQSITLSDFASSGNIDAGNVVFDFSAQIAGYQNGGDTAILELVFLDAASSQVGSTVTLDGTTGGADGITNTWDPFSSAGTVPANAQTARVQILQATAGSSNGNDNYVDLVALDITTIPEPSTFVLGSLGLLGFFRRRR